MGARADKLLNAAVSQVRNSGLAQETIRMGTVTSVATSGTIAVQRNDDVFPTVRVLGSYAPAVGDRVEIANTMGGWVCLGPLVSWDTSWQYPTLNSGFTQHGAGFADARYRRTATTLEIQGAVDPASSGEQALFNLLPGFRPSYNHTLCTWQSNGAAQMRVYTTGEVRVYPTSGTSWITLDCVVGL